MIIQMFGDGRLGNSNIAISVVEFICEIRQLLFRQVVLPGESHIP